MSFASSNRKLRAMTALAIVEREGRELIVRAARQEPVKVIARRIGRSPREVDNLRAGINAPSWLPFLALAQASPELRGFIARVLAFEERDPRTEALLAEDRKSVV